MKKYIIILATAVAALSLASCTEKLGTEPGNDTLPAVTPYNYAPTSEYDGDTDQRVRFVSNGKVTKAFYLVEKKADKLAEIASKGEDAYIEKVISQGTEISFPADGVFETIITDMPGVYDISVAATDGTNKTLHATTFEGIPWDADNGIEGTYIINRANVKSIVGASSFPAILQRHATDPTLYRIKGALGPGSKIAFQTIDLQGTDDEGTYTFFRIPEQKLPFTYGSYGNVSIRDVGYWQGDDAYVTENGYESGIYADGSCFLCLQYYVSAGSLGLAMYDYFVAD